MQKKGKLTSFQAKMYNGNHQNWNENWKFIMTFDNGDTGVGMSKNQLGNWTIGTEYSYEWQQGKYDVEFRKITDTSKPAYVPGASGGGGGSKGGGGYKKSPEQQKIIINQVALIAYNSVMNKLREPGNECYSAFKEWMYNKIFNLNQDPMTVQGVFKIACENIGNGMENSTIGDVLTRAEGFLSTVKNIEWKNPTQSPQQSNSQQSEQQQPPPPQNQPSQPPVEETHHEEAPPEENPPQGPFTI